MGDLDCCGSFYSQNNNFVASMMLSETCGPKKYWQPCTMYVGLIFLTAYENRLITFLQRHYLKLAIIKD